MKAQKIYRKHTNEYEESLDEKFISDNNRDIHWEKHRNQFTQDSVFSKMTADEYEKRAKLLQSMPVDNKKVFGYYGEHRAPSGAMRNAYYKYNKETQEYVVYAYLSDGQPKTIAYFRIPWSQYNGDKALQYVDEIKPGK